MARLTDAEFQALSAERAAGAAAPLESVRRASGALRNEETDAWLAAGDRLAEKAIAALDLGDDARADALVRRIVALPDVDEQVRSGLMAVGLLLVGEIVEPLEAGETAGLLDLPLRLLTEQDPVAALELRRALGTLLDYDPPRAVQRRIREVVDADQGHEPPFAGVPEAELPAAVAGVLRLVLRLRREG